MIVRKHLPRRRLSQCEPTLVAIINIFIGSLSHNTIYLTAVPFRDDHHPHTPNSPTHRLPVHHLLIIIHDPHGKCAFHRYDNDDHHDDSADAHDPCPSSNRVAEQ